MMANLVHAKINVDVYVHYLCLQSMAVRKVVGVEMVEQAVEDANVNVRLNGQLL